MEEWGVSIGPGTIHHSDFSVDAGLEITDRLLALAEVPTAVFTANDSLALGVMSAAQRAGVSVPDQLSVVGFNDTPLAARLAVPLTSVKVDFARIAADALDLLLSPAATDRPAVQPHLVERASVASI
ncbi:Catabolite control protein A [Microbacterium terrae]|uniref:Catabolite control protein A n=2 Tax=Microbacterium terrae TaxID=69369 RepID=A0A0M2HBN7_9MICO|nr:Catabolite control protein A [Microbacterium terrae]